MQQPRETKVSLDAARLGVNSVLLIALPGELLLGGPWPCPNGRIFDSDLVSERVWTRQRPPLDQVQVFTRPLKVGLRIHSDSVAVPFVSPSTPSSHTAAQANGEVPLRDGADAM